VSTGVLVALAVVAAGALMLALSAGAIASHPPSCTRNPLALNVAVAPELAPAVRAVAQDFNARQQPSRGRCIRIGVTAQDPAGAAALIDGQAAAHGAAVPAAWIPDSSLWVDVARSFPLGARAVQPAGIDVASSPLVLVTPRAVEQSTRIFAAPAGWSVLLPPSAGGPPASLRLRAALPDPAASAAGLATLLELSKLLGHTAAAQSELSSFEHGVQATGQFASPASLAALVASAGPPLDSRPVTVTTEQAVLAYDRAHPSAPLTADYPVSFQAGLGSPVLNYPYVVTTISPLLARAARKFGLALQQPQAVTAIRYAGFRSAAGTGAAMPGYTGLRGQVLQQAATPAAGAVQAAEQDWARLRPAPAALIVADTSPAMSAAAAGGGDLEQQAITAADLTAALLPGSAQAGEWQVPGPAAGSTTTSGTATGGTTTPAAGGTAGTYRELVSLGPLDSPASARPGALARGELLGQVTAALRAGGSQASVALNDTVLAAARKVAAASRPGGPAAVIVITAGSDGGKDAPASTLETGLHALASHHVQVIAIVLGHGDDLATWQQAAADSGGAVYQVTAPAQLGTAIRGVLARLR
jgi:hypothetical protein